MATTNVDNIALTSSSSSNNNSSNAGINPLAFDAKDQQSTSKRVLGKTKPVRFFVEKITMLCVFFLFIVAGSMRNWLTNSAGYMQIDNNLDKFSCALKIRFNFSNLSEATTTASTFGRFVVSLTTPRKNLAPNLRSTASTSSSSSFATTTATNLYLLYLSH